MDNKLKLMDLDDFVVGKYIVYLPKEEDPSAPDDNSDCGLVIRRRHHPSWCHNWEEVYIQWFMSPEDSGWTALLVGLDGVDYHCYTD